MYTCQIMYKRKLTAMYICLCNLLCFSNNQITMLYREVGKSARLLGTNLIMLSFLPIMFTIMFMRKIFAWK